MAADPLLDVRDLHVHFDVYDGTAEVINGVDLTLDRGETAALVGETGCGKSVTAKAIMGLLNQPPASVPKGELWFKGRDLLSLSPAERHTLRGTEMSMILQDPMTSLNPVYTVGEQMLDVLRWQGKHRIGLIEWARNKFRNEEALRERAIEMLERVQISAPERVFQSYPVELSGGMRQRVLIANALLSEPDFLIADEPGTALDVTTEARILELLERLVSESDASILYITHDLGVAREVSDHINVMYAGEIVEQAPTEELFSTPQHPYTRGLLESIPKLAGGIGHGIEGQLPDFTDPPKACRFADRCPYVEPECREVYPYRRRTSPAHTVACHLFDGRAVHARHESLAASDTVDIGDPPWLAESEHPVEAVGNRGGRE